MLDSVATDFGEGDPYTIDAPFSPSVSEASAGGSGALSPSSSGLARAQGEVLKGMALDRNAPIEPIDDISISIEDLRSSTISLPRLLRTLAAPSIALDYSTIRPVLLSLCSFSSPPEFVECLCDIYYRPYLIKNDSSAVVQVRFKIIAIIICWLEQEFAHSDLLSIDLQKKLRAVLRDALGIKDDFLYVVAIRARTQLRRVASEVRHLELATKLYFLRSAATQGLLHMAATDSAKAATPKPAVISLTSQAPSFSPTRSAPPTPTDLLGDFDDFNADREGSETSSQCDSLSHPSAGMVDDSVSCKEPLVVNDETEASIFPTLEDVVDEVALARSSYKSYAALFKSKSETLNHSPARAYTRVAAASTSLSPSVLNRSGPGAAALPSGRQPSHGHALQRGVSLIRDLEITASAPLTIMKQSIIESFTYNELAELLTGSELLLGWSQVRRRELLNLAWTKEDLKDVHPDLGGAAHLNRLIIVTNKRIIWVASEIIYYSVFCGPVSDALEYFILVASTAMKQKNFNLVFVIMSAIGLPCIMQLKLGWQNLSKSKYAIYSRLKQFCDPKSNNSMYRQALNREAGPFIPCLQILIKDLTIYENSHKSLVCGGKLIDMEKVVYMFDFLEKNVPKVSVSWGADCSVEDTEALVHNYSPAAGTYNIRIQRKMRRSTSGRFVSSPISPSAKSELSAAEDKYPSPGKRAIYDASSSTAASAAPSILVFPSFRDACEACANSLFDPIRRSVGLLSEVDSSGKRSFLWDREQKTLVLESTGLAHAHEGMEHSLQQASLLPLSDLQSAVRGLPAYRRKSGGMEEKSGPFSFMLQDKNIKKLESKIDSSCHDLATLWNDSKVANFAETRRLMLKLCKAGLV